jgi:hypothetical protein
MIKLALVYPIASHRLNVNDFLLWNLCNDYVMIALCWAILWISFITDLMLLVTPPMFLNCFSLVEVFNKLFPLY